MTLRKVVIVGVALAWIALSSGILLADYFFDDSVLVYFYSMSNSNACRNKCTFSQSDLQSASSEYSMERLELSLGDGKQIYLVSRTEGCGSAGCQSAVLLREAGYMVRIEESFGLDTDRAERIARAALGIGRTESGPQTPAVIVAALCVVTLCLLSAIITRTVAHGLTLWQRILAQTATALLSTGGLYLLGVVGEVNLLTIPLGAGVAVIVVASAKEIFS